MNETTELCDARVVNEACHHLWYQKSSPDVWEIQESILLAADRLLDLDSHFGVNSEALIERYFDPVFQHLTIKFPYPSLGKRTPPKG